MGTFEDDFNKAVNLNEQENREGAIEAYKQLLTREDARIQDRMMIHVNLAFVLSRGILQNPNVKTILTQEEIDECATNCSFAKHLYNHFLKDPASKSNLKPANDSAGATLSYCIWKLEAKVKNFSGTWRTERSMCEDFRRFKGYPASYYEEVPEPPSPKISKSKETSEQKKGCFIATAVYGSEFESEVVLFKEFRDSILQNYAPTRLLINLYYKVSPPIAGFISTSATRRFIVREFFLAPILFMLERWFEHREQK
jgi:hypothetical protein